MDVFTEAIKSYISIKGFETSILSTVKDTSYNETDGNYLCNSLQEVINMDSVARKCYRKICRPYSYSENDSVKSVDAIMTSKDSIYFVEYKDAKISKQLKKDISIKAYSTVLMLIDILEDSGKDFFGLNNPIDYFRKNVKYIFVYSSVKNPTEFVQENNTRLIGLEYTPEYMNKLKDYIFLDACAMSEQTFENDFLKDVIICNENK